MSCCKACERGMECGTLGSCENAPTMDGMLGDASTDGGSNDEGILNQWWDDVFGTGNQILPNGQMPNAAQIAIENTPQFVSVNGVGSFVLPSDFQSDATNFATQANDFTSNVSSAVSQGLADDTNAFSSLSTYLFYGVLAFGALILFKDLE